MCFDADQTSLWYEDWLLVGALSKNLDFVHISDVSKKVHDLRKDSAWDFKGLAIISPPRGYGPHQECLNSG